MKIANWQQNLSVGFELGSNEFSAEENLRLYGANPGQCMRGYNLLFEAFWKLEAEADFLFMRERILSELKAWDHCFLNDVVDFQKGPYTLERATRTMSEKLKVLVPLVQLQIQQSDWTCKTDLACDFKEVSLSYQTFFRTALSLFEGQMRPLDLSMQIEWSGTCDAKSFILHPWRELKASLIESQRTLELKPQAFFERFAEGGVEEFLTEVAEIVKRHSSFAASVRSVKFTDKITKESWII